MATHPTEHNGTTVELVEKMAHELGHNASARLVFAEPIERDGVSVIPVAKVRYGFGGGEKGSDGQPDMQSGAGGGLHADPLGYIELKGGATRFRPIFDPVTFGRIAFGAFFVSIWAASMIAKRRR